ncbi:MAG: ATP-binding protein [Leptolyngbyaceae bacterium]|nr:ATP-binding protein [Leptolyngbyaceae bacterium]
MEELQRQYQRARLFAEVTLKIRQSLHLNEILQTTVVEVQRILNTDRVLIYQVFADKTGKTISEAVLPDYKTILDMEFPEEVFPKTYQDLYSKGRVQAIADVHAPAAGLTDCLVDFVDQFSVQAKLIVPIVLNLGLRSADTPAENGGNQLWGLLIAHHCQAPRQWTEFEVDLMQQLADQIGIAIAHGQLMENLETIVAQRTAELRQVNQNLQQEIADRVQAEDSLRQNEEQLRLITDTLPVLIAYVDHQERYRFNNAAFKIWLGKSPETMRGKRLRQIWGGATYNRIRPWVKKALAGETVHYENEICRFDQTICSVDVTYIPHQDEKTGKIKGFFALTSDISDRKAIERMKDEFISVVSHELRTPLTSIHSSLKLLSTGQLGTLSPDGQQILGIADDNTDRLVRLVNNVLDLQRIESGDVTMDRQACNASDLMVKATEAMQAMAQQYEVQLLTQPLSIPLWVDPDYIVQALTNLLSNAIKFSAPGTTVTLSVQEGSAMPPSPMALPPPATAQGRRSNARQRESGQSASDKSNSSTAKSQKCDPQKLELGDLKSRKTGSMVRFCVQDQGQGIPKNKLESIFERFHQVDSSDARKKGGTGLGLTICRKIIDQHDGEIWAESTEGEGSTFIFTLPLWSPE